MLTPSFDALAASLKVPDGEPVSFDVIPAPALPMAPWPPRNSRPAPETTVRILRPSVVREAMVALASFLVVTAIGVGLVFFFGEKKPASDAPAGAATSTPTRKP